MKSQTSQAVRNYRIRELVTMVHKYRNRPSGMSVDEWCQVNNITKANYYYRLVQVRKAYLDSIPSDVIEHAIIPGPMDLMHPESEQKSSSLLKRVPGVLAYVEWCYMFWTHIHRIRVFRLRSGTDRLVAIIKNDFDLDLYDKLFRMIQIMRLRYFPFLPKTVIPIEVPHGQ